MNRRSLSWIAALLLVFTLALWGAAAAQDLVPQPTLDAAVEGLFTATAAAQTAMPVTQTVEAAFNQAYSATVIPQITATADAQRAADATLLDDADALLADIPQSRGADGAFILGDPNAPVTIIEFADYACPHCLEYRPVIEQFIRDYVATGQAAFEFRIFPTAGGQLTVLASAIAECAQEQRPNTFFQISEVAYELAEQGRYNDQLWQPLVQTFDLNIPQLEACFNATSPLQVEVDAIYGRSLGITGTPAVRVRYGGGAAEVIELNGTAYPNGRVPFEVLAAVVEAAQPTAAVPTAEPTVDTALIEQQQTLAASLANIFGLDNTESDYDALIADIPQSRGADGAFILGEPNAPITVIVFADWRCPHCQTYHDETIIPFIESEVASGRAALEARLFPTAGGATTVTMAQAVECMVEGGASFWSLDHVLFERARTGDYNTDTIRALAANAGVRFEEVMACAVNADQVVIDTEFGRSLGVSGTPAVLIRIGDSEPEFIVYENITYNRGPVPLDVLTAVVAAAHPS
jgi:protein-disulfide isomerase